MSPNRNKFQIFMTRSECEENQRVQAEIRPDSMLDRRIPIFWLEMGKAETANYAQIYVLGEDLFGSPNSLMRLRRIANAKKSKSGEFWIPIKACTVESRIRAERAYKSDDLDRYSYAFNKSRKIGKQSMSVSQFIDEVADPKKRGGHWAFYCKELKGGADEHYWKTGIAEGKEAALNRLRFQRDRMFCRGVKDPNAKVLWHCLITDLANEDVARNLEDAVQKTFGDICCLWKHDPTKRFGWEQFRNVDRIIEVAKLLRPLSATNLPKEWYSLYFAQTD
jgi:hypothetical protein